jgi:hypothetical protein
MTDSIHKAQDEAEAAARIKAARIVSELQKSGRHWTLTVKPKEDK